MGQVMEPLRANRMESQKELLRGHQRVFEMDQWWEGNWGKPMVTLRVVQKEYQMEPKRGSVKDQLRESWMVLGREHQMGPWMVHLRVPERAQLMEQY